MKSACLPQPPKNAPSSFEIFVYLTVTLKWIPAHLDDPAKAATISIPADITPADKAGNKEADTFAKEGAGVARMDDNAAQPVLYYTQLVERIQRRLAAIVQSIPPRTGERFHNPPPPVQPPLVTLFGESQHLPFFHPQ